MADFTISIIIPVFNRLEYTKKCLANLTGVINNSDIPERIINLVVVDDGSRDGTSVWIKEHYPMVHLVFGNGSLWWSGGVNMGIKYAVEKLKTDYILWWNNDIVAAPDYFKILLRIIQTSPENLLIGSKIFRLNKEILFGIGGRFDEANGAYEMYGHNLPDSTEFTQPIESDWFPGMGTTIHKSVFQKIGYVDEKNFPQYHGDSDFTLRAKKSGFQLTAFPELKIYNDGDNRKEPKNLIHSLTQIGSLYNIRKDFLFFRRHTNSLRAYMALIRKYIRYIGGYYKWKFLTLIGVKKDK